MQINSHDQPRCAAAAYHAVRSEAWAEQVGQVLTHAHGEDVAPALAMLLTGAVRGGLCGQTCVEPLADGARLRSTQYGVYSTGLSDSTCLLRARSNNLNRTTYLDLFVGIPVSDYIAVLEWYERLLGSPPTFFPTDTEAVWELGEHRYVYIVQQPEHAGHARFTVFVDNLDVLIAQIAHRGVAPVEQETYANGVRKITYRDCDGNEIGFGGAS